MAKHNAPVSLEYNIAIIKYYNILLSLLKDENYETNPDYQTLISLDSKTKENLLEIYLAKRARNNVRPKTIANVARFLELEKPIGLAKAKMFALRPDQTRPRSITYVPPTAEIEIPYWGVPFMEAQVMDDISKSQSTLSDEAESLINKLGD